MMDHNDFYEIDRLLERCCDNCLLTRMHCPSCRIEKLRGITGHLSKSAAYELINLEDLKTLVKLAGDSHRADGKEREVVEKWRQVAWGDPGSSEAKP
ncbi:hypothetical protein [Pelotomaculum propionicicum]|uniref:Uncharacterized protein n=1 Tax=Pelotomaculum propionicicum TaxID=258475 RepID=A0A4Y7RL10_9FIRM|nr:hypothetical protein [Pelotomaculum propionicicum]NLI11767.1 hypothetical protein [Peptococcaceae bacterium]TEB09491.1 hypothetical protein Pmgp_03091 [Pelotomaculum propionicicum]